MFRTGRNALQIYFRRRRYQALRALFPLDDMGGLLLDLGGGPAGFFAAAFPRPRQVILVEISHKIAREARDNVPDLQPVVADGRHLPFAAGSVALTVCNSVIEHVAGPDRLAAEIERVSRRYFVQTPAGDFPLEFHSFFPIPYYRRIPWTGLRRALCRLLRADFDYLESVGYLSAAQLRRLFAGAILNEEKVAGLTKSYYLVRRGSE